MEAIKPRQIINYDAGIVLIDLHQLNVNNFRQYKSATLNTGTLSCQRRTEPAEQQPATSAFLTKWLNKVTSLLSKRVGNFSAWVIEACRRRLTSEKRAYTSIKSDEEWTSRVLPSEQDDIVNSLNYEGIAVIELQFYHFPDSDGLRVGSVTDK